MIGSWSNRIIDESRCHVRDRHTLDTPNSDVNYVTLELDRTEQTVKPKSDNHSAGYSGKVQQPIRPLLTLYDLYCPLVCLND